MKGGSISLGDELAALADGLEAVELLAELLANESLLDTEDARRVPRLLQSSLALLGGRARLLRKVVLREVPAELLASRRNARRPPVRPWEDADIILDGKPRRRGR